MVIADAWPSRKSLICRNGRRLTGISRSRCGAWWKWDDTRPSVGGEGFGKRTVEQLIRALKQWNLKISAIAKLVLFPAVSSKGHFWLEHLPRKHMSFYL